MNKLALLTKSQNGVVLINILVISIILTMVGLSMADLAMRQFRRTANNVYITNATLTAEAGIEQTLHQLNLNNSFAGYSSEQEFYNDERGRAIFTTQVTDGSGSEKIILSTARAYRQNSDALVSERKIRVSLVGTSSNEPSVFAGVGGLILGGNANISNSEVFVNGKITMSGSAIIGSATNPLTVNVAHNSCPQGINPGATYPRVCTSDQPISFGSNNRIFGTVCATNQTSTSSGNKQIIQGDSTGSGLLVGCVAPPREMIPYDRADHLSRVATTSNATNIQYNCTTSMNPNGNTRTWAANIRINGNVTFGSSCDVTLTGDVHITGNVTISGGARIRVADSLGNRRPVVMVDGTITGDGGAQIIENSSGMSVHFITFRSTAACSPNCTNVTGTDLYNSQNQLNILVEGGGSFPGTIFQAYWSKVKLSGTGLMGSAIGQTIDLEGAGNITFGLGLSSGTTTWTIRSYQRDFN
jgi:phage baseplate assembly protein gpV